MGHINSEKHMAQIEQIEEIDNNERKINAFVFSTLYTIFAVSIILGIYYVYIWAPFPFELDDYIVKWQWGILLLILGISMSAALILYPLSRICRNWKHKIIPSIILVVSGGIAVWLTINCDYSKKEEFAFFTYLFCTIAVLFFLYVIITLLYNNSWEDMLTSLRFVGSFLYSIIAGIIAIWMCEKYVQLLLPFGWHTFVTFWSHLALLIIGIVVAYTIMVYPLHKICINNSSKILPSGVYIFCGFMYLAYLVSIDIPYENYFLSIVFFCLLILFLFLFFGLTIQDIWKPEDTARKAFCEGIKDCLKKWLKKILADDIEKKDNIPIVNGELHLEEADSVYDVVRFYIYNRCLGNKEEAKEWVERIFENTKRDLELEKKWEMYKHATDEADVIKYNKEKAEKVAKIQKKVDFWQGVVEAMNQCCEDMAKFADDKQKEGLKKDKNDSKRL